MPKRILTIRLVLIFISFSFLSSVVSAEDDQSTLDAMWAVRKVHNFPPDYPLRFVEKKDSPIPGFYAVKLIVPMQDREVPIIVYVNSEADKVLVGTLFVSGENVTKKEAGHFYMLCLE